MDIAAGTTTGNKEHAEDRQSKVSSHSDTLHKRHLKTSLALICAMLLSTLSTILLLYFETLETEEQNLRRTLQTETNLIESVARFDAIYSLNDTQGGAKQATIDQVVAAHDHKHSLNSEIEFSLGERIDKKIYFELPPHHLEENGIKSADINAPFAQPMKRALEGEAGSMFTKDFEGHQVLAAYQPIPSLDMGIVANMEMAVIRAPFIKAALISLTIVVALVLIGLVQLHRFYKSTSNEHHWLEIQLRQAQKLESVGQLAAGVAHEINTPTQFVGDNITFLKGACQDLQELCRKYDHFVQEAPEHEKLNDLKTEIEGFKKQIDMEFLLKDINSAVDQSIEGTQRISSIVKAIKSFSHPGSSDKEKIDLNHAIESTVTVASNEWKYVADVETELDPELRLVNCFAGEINQTVLNIIVNAAHAIEEKQKSSGNSEKGLIKITTQQQGNKAIISISDTGCGIPEALLQKIYDPFFTTKAVGKGTGQGLSIAYSVITEKHGGSLTVQSNPEKGSVFEIRLPL